MLDIKSSNFGRNLFHFFILWHFFVKEEGKILVYLKNLELSSDTLKFPQTFPLYDMLLTKNKYISILLIIFKFDWLF